MSSCKRVLDYLEELCKAAGSVRKFRFENPDMERERAEREECSIRERQMRFVFKDYNLLKRIGDLKSSLDLNSTKSRVAFANQITKNNPFISSEIVEFKDSGAH